MNVCHIFFCGLAKGKGDPEGVGHILRRQKHKSNLHSMQTPQLFDDLFFPIILQSELPMMKKGSFPSDMFETTVIIDTQKESSCCDPITKDLSTLNQCQLCKKDLYTHELDSNDFQCKLTLQEKEIAKLKQEVESYKIKLERQQSDYHTLHTNYMAITEQLNGISQQKNQADREIEELSTRLFEEANVMVANERKKSMKLEKMLERTEEQLKMEQGQLRDLKDRIESIFNAPKSYLPDIKDSLTQTNNFESNRHERRRSGSGSAIKLLSTSYKEKVTAQEKLYYRQNDSKDACIDAGLSSVRQFQSYIDQFKSTRGKKPAARLNSSIETATLSHSNSNNSIARLDIKRDHDYIQLCEKEDIEPCLQFGIASSRICTKTMMEHMIQKPCFIESVTMREARRISPAVHSSAIYRPFWERLATTTASNLEEDIYIECVACKRKFHILQYLDQHFYRFRLDEKEDWLLIDRTCRNRLVAVCDFYGFLRNIQLGYYQGRTLRDLYAENVQLRMQMFYSR